MASLRAVSPCLAISPGFFVSDVEEAPLTWPNGLEPCLEEPILLPCEKFLGGFRFLCWPLFFPFRIKVLYGHSRTSPAPEPPLPLTLALC
jgi:hypothetical protein